MKGAKPSRHIQNLVRAFSAILWWQWFATVNATDTPTLNLEYFQNNVSHRQDVCGRHHLYMGGNMILRDALQGLKLNVVLRNYGSNPTPGVNLDSNEAIDESNPGLAAMLLDELAKRAGFTWRDSFGIGPFANQTFDWSDVLDWTTEVYDIDADFFTLTVERLSRGVGSPAGIQSGNYILLEDTGVPGRGWWRFIRIYDKWVWLAIFATIFAAGIFYEILEMLSAPSSKQRIWHVKKGLYHSSLTALQHYSFQPKSPAGNFFSLAVAFWSLLIVSAYTANLASFFVVDQVNEASVTSIQDALRQGKTICVYQTTAQEDYVDLQYPEAKDQFKKVGFDRPHFLNIYRNLLNSTCDLALVSEGQWRRVEKNERDLGNGICNVRPVGDVVLFSELGFGIRLDSGEKCTNLIRDALSIHIMEMKNIAMETEDMVSLDTILDNHYAQYHNGCSFDSDSSSTFDEGNYELSLQDMAGLFLILASASVASLLLALCSYFSNSKRPQGENAEGDTESKSNSGADLSELRDLLDQVVDKIDRLETRVAESESHKLA